MSSSSFLKKNIIFENSNQLGKDAIAISVITYYELYVGIEKSPNKDLALKMRAGLESNESKGPPHHRHRIMPRPHSGGKKYKGI